MTRPVVVFDAYGTLFDPHGLAARLEAALPGRGAALSDTWRDVQLRATWLTSLMGVWIPFERLTADALRSACRAHELAVEARFVDDLVEAYRRLPAYPDVPEALGTVDAVILSNGGAAMLGEAVEAAGLGTRVSAILSAEAARVYKPSPQVYALATAHLDRAPAEVTFVSGNGWDCAGAAAFGFRVVRLAREAVLEEAVPAPEMPRISSLGQLPSLLSEGAH